MPRILALLAFTLASWCLIRAADAAPKEVEVTGSGMTRQDAITDGLVQALGQVRGVAIASVSAARSELASRVSSNDQSATLTEAQQSATLQATGGFVSGYRVLSVAAGVPVEVAMSVTVEVFEPKGLGNESRRRIAVTAFVVQGAGDTPSPLASLLRDRITAHLVQARRFAVLDREQEGAYAAEMRLLSQEAPMAEQVRAGQVIGADYVVVGKFRQTAATQSSEFIGLTGETVTHRTAGSAEADYQVIEIATRQIKYAGSVRIEGAGAVDAVGGRVADEITQAVYPLRLIRFTDPANLIVGQGGESLRPGQRFRAMVLGEALIDPYTKESLGQVEEEAGIVVIRRVESKVSYAQLISGKLPEWAGGDVQILLRPAGAPPGAAGAARARRTAEPAATVTKLPFDP